MTQEAISRELKVSVRTWNRWENGETEPSPENLGKLINLVKKRANKEFRWEFLNQIIYGASILTFGKKEKEIIKDIKKNWEKLKHSPIIQKIFQEHPEYQNLPFEEIFKRYTKNKISFNGSFILNSLPIPLSLKKKYPKIKKTQKIKNNNRIVKNKGKKTPKEKNTRNKKNPDNKNDSESEEGDASDEWKEESKKVWEDYYKRPITNIEIEEIQLNLCNFFKVLRKWYTKEKRR
jgi:transcriptional regulator with XRE-family HTH domain